MNDQFTVNPDEAAEPVFQIPEREIGIKSIIAYISPKEADIILAHYKSSILRKVFGDAELMRTADCFLHSNLNISAAARNIFMHRNTMMYRLDKIERLTGLDIRTYDDAITFDILHMLYDRRARSGK